MQATDINLVQSEATVRTINVARRIEHEWVIGKVAAQNGHGEGEVVARVSFSHWKDHKAFAASFMVMVRSHDGIFQVEAFAPFSDGFTFAKERVDRFSAKRLEEFSRQAEAVFFGSDALDKALVLIGNKITESGGLL